MPAFLGAVADAVNPLLAIVALAIVAFEWRRSRKVGVAYLAAAALGLGGVYGVSALDAAFKVWPRFGGDYSLHTAFAVSVGITITIWRRRWLAWMLLLVSSYLILIVFLRYHSIADVLSAAVVAFLITALGHFVVKRVTKIGGADREPA